jgi:hypothetical protein
MTDHLTAAEARRRWESKVKRGDGCWEWTGAISEGYGQFWFRGRVRRAHRAAYILFRGEIPEGAHVLHRCDNRACVNPDHLFLGTNLDNILDRVAKGRSLPMRGSANGRARLNEEDVGKIKRLLSAGVGAPEVAQRYGVAHATIHCIQTGRNWGWLS